MEENTLNPLKEKLHEIIFEADTPMGKVFDIVLMVFIIASVLVVMLESVQTINQEYQYLFEVLEWVFTIFFTIEYVLRLYCVYRPMKYALSFFGVIDLLAILPTYISFLFPEVRALAAVRAMRILRVFRIFKLGRFLKEGYVIMSAMRASVPKITFFLVFIVLVVTVMGSVMYIIEGGVDSTFDSIPRSIYWAIVTLTTVGYGDISPTTGFGQFIASVIMIMGYVVIAVPTGIVSAELVSGDHEQHNSISCRYCAQEGHDDDAVHCKYCGELLVEEYE